MTRGTAMAGGDAPDGRGEVGRELRIGALAPYPEEGPSTRYRLLQFQEPLRERGIELEILPFLDAGAYGRIYGAGAFAKGRAFLRGWWRRVGDVAAGARFDAWIVHRELAPLGNGFLEERLARSGRPYLFDFDDAIYLPQPGGDRRLQRIRDPEADARRFVRNAAAVLAGNATLAAFAEEARGTRDGVHILPTVVDTERYRPREGVGDARPRPKAPDGVALARAGEGARVGLPIVGWVGTHTTAPYLAPLVPTLRRLMERIPFRVRVVSNRPPECLASAGSGFEFEPWSAEREVEQVREFSIGIYPLEDTAWERGKCGLKAIQYMACGIPVVGSRVGVLPQVVPHGEAGFLVDPGGDWSPPLAELLRDPERRARMGLRGREQSERRYSVASVVDRLAAILREAAGAAGSSRAGRGNP